MNLNLMTLRTAFLTATIIIVSCDKGTEPAQVAVPVVSTIEVTNITSSSAITGGNITSDGGAVITSKGVCWSINTSPTITDSRTTDGTGAGLFTSTITGLTANTTYYIRAYAINSAGTGYGNVLSFSTMPTNTSIDYLGQTPPGLTPAPLAHNIFRNFALHSSPAFSPDGNGVFWSAFDMSIPNQCKYQIWFMRKENGVWGNPQKATFLLNALGDSPTFTPDGSKLFFLSCAPTPENPANTKENLYYVNKTSSGWSQPILLHQGFDSYIFHWQVSIVNNGNIYFSGHKADDTGADIYDIHVAHNDDGSYSNFENMGDAVNTTEELESTPWVSPDESYLIFSRGGTISFSDLFISFRNNDGAWTEARIMNGLNSAYHDINPIVTPDGKYLIFTSQQDGWPYWVDISVIEQFR